MRVCRALARDALAAPSSFVQLLDQLFFNMGKGLPASSNLFDTTAVAGKYSTALSRPGQHYFSTASVTRGRTSPAARS
jgi:hypothetical protein